MVAPAQQDEVVELRFAAVGPVLHVVSVAEAQSAAREAAAGVPMLESAPQGG
jgi:hypothetical protein